MKTRSKLIATAIVNLRRPSLAKGSALAASIGLALALLGCPKGESQSAVPGLLVERMAAHESSAAACLRTINAAALLYSTTYNNGYPRSLATLGPPPERSEGNCGKANIIDEILASGRKSGYVFEYKAGAPFPSSHHQCPAGARSYRVVAFPMSPATGRRSFYTDESGVIRYTENGMLAGASDPILP